MNFKDKRRVWSCTLRDGDCEERRALEKTLLGREADYAEDARALRRYAELCGINPAECAGVLGRSTEAMEERLSLTALPDDVLDGLVRAGLGERYARALLRLREGDEQRRCLALFREQHLSAEEAEELTFSLAPGSTLLGSGSAPLLSGSFERCAESLRRWGVDCRVKKREETERLVLTITIEKRRFCAETPEKDEIFIKKELYK